MKVVKLLNDVLLRYEVVVSDMSLEVFLYGHAVTHDALQKLLPLLALLRLRAPIFNRGSIWFLDPHFPHSVDKSSFIKILKNYI